MKRILKFYVTIASFALVALVGWFLWVVIAKPALLGPRSNREFAQTASDMRAIQQMLESYKSKYGRFPENFIELTKFEDFPSLLINNPIEAYSLVLPKLEPLPSDAPMILYRTKHTMRSGVYVIRVNGVFEFFSDSGTSIETSDQFFKKWGIE